MVARRGTTNRNARGSSRDRRRRREWLIENFRAEVDVQAVYAFGNVLVAYIGVPLGTGEHACRCVYCNVLLTCDTVTADRIIPGVEGGTYRRDNIQPSCARDNESQGGKLAARRRKEAVTA